MFTWTRGNHTPILLQAGVSPNVEEGNKPFKFESLWLSNDDCKKVVEDAWLGRLGGGGWDIQFKIAECGQGLSTWAKFTFGAVRKKIKKAERSLSKLQNCAPHANVLQTCKALSDELDNLHRLEESHWFIRARSNELKDDDKNTKYFHHKASS